MNICTKCGKVNEDGMRFCEECGNLLDIIKPPARPLVDTDKNMDFLTKVSSGNFFKEKIASFNKMNKEIESYVTKKKTLVPHKIALCDGEIPIKQYHCATEKLNILGINIKSFIQVTNKRIVYCRLGSSFIGSTVYQSEAPLSDISSVSLERGNKINLFALIMSILLYISLSATAVSLSYCGATISIIAIILGILLLVIYFGLKFFGGKKDLGTTLYGIGVFLLAGGLGVIAAGIVAPLFLILGLPWLLDMVVSKFFRLKVGSKSASSYPISEGGVEAYGATADILEAFISAVPSDDIDSIERELNAMILDIQQLGDYGIEKWKEK